MMERRSFSPSDFLRDLTLEQIEVAADATIMETGSLTDKQIKRGLDEMVRECTKLWADWPASDMVFLPYGKLLEWAVLVRTYNLLPEGHPIRQEFQGSTPDALYGNIFRATIHVK